MILTGFPIIFDSKSVNLGGFVEVVRPSAVDRTLRTNADVARVVERGDAVGGSFGFLI